MRRADTEGERERSERDREDSGEDIISPMQIAFGLRPAKYTLGLAAPVRPHRIFRCGWVFVCRRS